MIVLQDLTPNLDVKLSEAATKSKIKFGMYPNPTYSTVIISLTEKEDVILEVIIRSFDGKELSRIVPTEASDHCSLNFENFTQGIYLIETKTMNNLHIAQLLSVVK